MQRIRDFNLPSEGTSDSLPPWDTDRAGDNSPVQGEVTPISETPEEDFPLFIDRCPTQGVDEIPLIVPAGIIERSVVDEWLRRTDSYLNVWRS